MTLYPKQIKFINVHRNPIDIIAAYAHYWKEPIGIQHVQRYIENAEANLKIKSMIAESCWMDIDQTEFTLKPDLIISNIFKFLDVGFSKQQVLEWTSIVNSKIKPKSSQMKIPDFIHEALNAYIKKGNTN